MWVWCEGVCHTWNVDPDWESRTRVTIMRALTFCPAHMYPQSNVKGHRSKDIWPVRPTDILQYLQYCLNAVVAFWSNPAFNQWLILFSFSN